MIVSPLLRSIWHYRGFVFGSVKREFQAKYSNAILGSLWSLLSPLAMIIVYTVIFSEVMRARLPGHTSGMAYSIYLCSGILTWGLFSEIVSRAQNVFLENANLIKKISFPRTSLPLIVVLSALLNFAIVFGLFTVFLVLSGNLPGAAYVSILAVLAVQVMFAIGLGIVVGVLNVFFRDVGQFMTIAMQFWFWLTPIVYPVSILPPEVRGIVDWNPMAAIVGAYQTILVEGRHPDFATLLPALVIALGLCALGFGLFRKRSGEMVDEL